MDMENSGSRRILFFDWNDWWSYTGKAVLGFVMCLISIVYAIVAGFVTLIYKTIMFVKRLIANHPICSLSLLCFMLAFGWFATFVGITKQLRTCELQRDSIAYEKLRIVEALQGDTIIIGKTIK